VLMITTLPESAVRMVTIHGETSCWLNGKGIIF
jgi:hypothetical protein